MKITIIGTGKVGGALTKRWVDAGHEVILGVRNLNNIKARELVTYNRKKIKILAPSEAAEEGEIIVVATPAHAAIDVGESIGIHRDKVIIDATNAIYKKPDPFPHATAALSEICQCRHVVKCFNCTGFENMEDPVYGKTTVDMFVAGDSEKGKAVAVILADDAGFEDCFDFGGSDKIELLEQFAKVWINLAVMQGYGRDIAFKLIMREDYKEEAENDYH